MASSDPAKNGSATMNSPAGELEGEGRKVVAAPAPMICPSKEEIDSWGEDVPRELRAWKANRTKKVVRRLEQWEIDGAMTLEVDDYVPRELPGSPEHQDPELVELRDLMVKAMWRSREFNRQYQALVRQEYESKGYVDMEFIVPDDDFEPESDTRRMSRQSQSNSNPRSAL